MKTRFLLIVGAVITLVSLSAIVMIETYHGQIEWKEKVGGLKDTTIPSAQEFLNMDCENLNHFYPEFPNKEVANAWIARMHECLNENEN